MNPKKMPVFKLPIYYCKLFKLCLLFKVLRCGNTGSFYWTLQEPQIFGSRFDVLKYFYFPFLADLLIKSQVTTLGTYNWI